jgi:hypothetical protein
MKQSKIVLGLRSLNNNQLETLGNTVLNGMKANPDFPNPSPIIADFEATMISLTKTISDAQSRDKLKITVRNSVRATVESMLTSLANYVTYTAQGDRAMMMGSGFPLNNIAPGIPPVLSIDSFNLVLGKNPGELLASAKSSPAADMHMYQIAPAPLADPKDFDTQYRGAAKFLFTGLVPMKLYAVRIGAIAANGQTVYTQTLVKAPQ